ncbi:CHRD domain-containing protein [Variovorax sp. 38R]|uniref:CHRD domain-containing protein n=1 Tax=Variovorax sp. 38R TaxID=2774875 RepID=UPI0017822D0B|nr:CHRD domain-containing protein [Variovorax sp. 38R]QOF76859.1 CHRD domain-containing protein [Variovorax sp. 38R]
MPDPARQTLRRRIVLFGATLAATGCALVSRFGPQEPATSSQPKEQPTWFMADCWLGTEEVVPPLPKKSSKGGGSMFGTLTLATGSFQWRVNYARLSGPATSAGFHGPAAKGSNGPLVIQLPPHSQAERRDPEGDGYELTGTSTLTPAQMADLMAGLWYVSVSTQAWPAGEVRGQMKHSTAGVHGV